MPSRYRHTILDSRAFSADEETVAAARMIRQVTDGTQLCFASTRDGGQPELYVVVGAERPSSRVHVNPIRETQVFVMSRTGENVKQITYTGNNYQPDWSKD